MSDLLSHLPDLLRSGPAVLVSVVRAEGSVPRDAGTWMAVSGDRVLGTIGGGRLEFDAIAQARSLLAQVPDGAPAATPQMRRFALGPSLGQCCGGVVHLQFESIDAGCVDTLTQHLRARLQPLALFGGGHVGQALVRVLATLPYTVSWFDSRDGVFPGDVPASVHCEHSDPVQGAVATLAPGSAVLVMSFSHAEDLDIVAACLRRLRAQDDLPWIGLIGSRTKWATFRHRLEERGFSAQELDRVTCPIGIPGIQGKEPEVIAVAVAAQLLQQRAQPS
ncbi:MAG: xanthine dehydrogenase accessory protein XdhC [Ramlibacter sp.]|nr:xanthine dehydrogenase accessory protein XdhC [Ramlibacter sp.]